LKRFSFVLVSLFASIAALLVGCGERTSLTTECAWGSDCEGEPVAAAPPDGGNRDAANEPVEASPDTSTTTVTPDASGVADAAEDVAYPASDLADIFVVSGVYATGASSSVEAFFYTSPASLGCTRSVVAGCVKTVCGPPLVTASEGLASAGSLSVTAGSSDLTLAQEDAGDYSSTAASVSFNGGDPILVSATGGDVDPFTMATTAPNEIVVTAMPSIVTRTQPFTVEWTGTSAGNVAVDLQVTTSDGDEYLECLFDPRAGQGVVPSEALVALPAGTGAASVGAITVTEIAVGTWAVKAIAESYATDTRGNEVNAGATFE